MNLALHSARTDRPPADEVRIVLAEGRIEELGCRR